jgi:multicomponent Na+:H+ antiporter subunit A
MPGLLLGAGLFLSAGTGLASLAFGGDVLQSWIFDLRLPPIGDVHLVTSVFFDIGVYLVVIGLILDILRSLGSGLDQLIEAGDDPSVPPPSAHLLRGPR